MGTWPFKIALLVSVALTAAASSHLAGERRHRTLTYTRRAHFVYVATGNKEILQFRVAACAKLKPLNPPAIHLPGRVYSLTISPTGPFLYAPEGDYFSVAQFRIGRNGLLRPLKPAEVQADAHPTAVAVSPNGRFAYVSCSHGDICQYRLEPNGALTPLSPKFFYLRRYDSSDREPSQVTFDRAGRTAFVTVDSTDEEGNDQGEVYELSVGRGGALRYKDRAAISGASQDRSGSIAVFDW
jgi:DNA-binding beta-propeller fold protein YncE